MSSRAAPRSIEQYLAALREALSGEDPALVQDALYDAEEYLRAEVASQPDKSEADVLELIASTYGAPDEVADAYRSTERKVQSALSPPPRREPKTALGRFFGVYGDSRTWTSLFFMLLSLVTGIVYFTVTVTGLSMSVGLLVLIIGIPFFLLFVGFSRVLALAEGRLVEGLLGQRMPRRPLYPKKGQPLWSRIKDMLLDRRTWTTMFYFLLMLPLGIAYFVIAVAGVSIGLGLTLGPVLGLLVEADMFSGGVSMDDSVYYTPWPLFAPLVIALGLVVLTAVLHLVRGIGGLHGKLAKHLLVAQSGSAD